MECETCGRQEAVCDVCDRTFCGVKQCGNHRYYCYLRSQAPFLEHRCLSEDGEHHVDGCQQANCNFSSATKHNLWMHGHRAKQAIAKGCQKRKLKSPKQSKYEMQRAEAVKIFDDAHDVIDEERILGDLIDQVSPEELLDMLSDEKHEPVFTELPQRPYQGGKSPRYPPKKRQKRSSSSEPSSSTSSDSTADPGSSDTSSSDDSDADDDDRGGICVPQSWLN